MTSDQGTMLRFFITSYKVRLSCSLFWSCIDLLNKSGERYYTGGCELTTSIVFLTTIQVRIAHKQYS
jgi:hypothetical protein